MVWQGMMGVTAVCGADKLSRVVCPMEEDHLPETNSRRSFAGALWSGEERDRLQQYLNVPPSTFKRLHTERIRPSSFRAEAIWT